MVSMILTIAILICVVALLGLMFKCGISSTDVPDASKEFSKEEMKEWMLWRCFYVNPDDPRGWVPKTWGYGWTVNFRTKENARIFAGLIVLTLLLVCGLVLSVTVCS